MQHAAQTTEAAVWMVAGAVFMAVVAAVVAGGLLWERRRQAKGWRHIAEELARLGGPAEPAQEVAVKLARSEQARGRVAEALLQRLPMRARLERLLEQAAAPWDVWAYLVRVAGAAAGVGLVAFFLAGSWAIALVGTAVGAALPYLYVVHRRRQRLAKFEENLPDAIGLLTRAVRAGHPFSAGLKMMADEAREPIAGEFRRVFEEQKFGLPLQESLLGLADRVDLVDVRMFVIAVLVQREIGGSLAEIMEEIADTIRERLKIRRQVKVYTAQGRMTGLMLSLLPIGLGAVLALLNPRYMSLLVNEPLGQAMLAAAAVMQMIGYVTIRRITNIEV